MSKRKKVFIALTAYDSRVDVLNMLSIFNNIKTLELAGIEYVMKVQMGDCYIDNARNSLVDEFIKTDCTDLIFVDSDLAFSNDAMIRLLNHPVQAVGGAYPYRGDQEGYPLAIKQDENGVPIGNLELGLIETTHVPTGLLRIRRDVFEILKNKYPDRIDDKGIWKFFLTGLLFYHEGDKRYYGEDVSFCKICERAGIIVWCEPRIDFAHIGKKNYEGNYHKYLLNGAKGKA
jgi:hypothetical protein